MPGNINKLRLGLFTGGGSNFITAILRPEGQLRPGQNASDDLPNAATFDSTSNYTSTKGSIVSVDYQVNGVSVALNTVLVADDAPTFVVTDSAGKVRTFRLPAVNFLTFTGTGAIVIPAATLSGTTVRTVSGTGAVSIPSVVVSGTGERSITATGAITTGAVAVSGTGTADGGGETITGSGAITIGAATVSGAGTVGELYDFSLTDNTGSTRDEISVKSIAGGTLYAGIYPNGTGTGDVTPADLIAGTDTSQIGSAYELATLTGGGGLLSDVDIDPTGLTAGTTYFVALVLNIDDGGTYSNVVGGNFVANFPYDVTASGALTLGAVTVSGTGERTIASSGALTIGAVQVSGAGVVTQVVGSGAITIPAATVSGSGTVTAGSSPYAENGFTPTVIADFAGIENSGTENYSDASANTAFGDMFTFARASNATYFNSSGVLTTATSGNARRNAYRYNGSTWALKGLRLESDARTNSQAQSSLFSGYSNTALGSTSNNVNSPLGTNTGATHTVSTTSNVHRVFNNGYTNSSTTVTGSMFVKAGATYSQCAIRENAISGAAAVFELSTGTLDGTHSTGTISVVATSIEEFPDGWYRISATFEGGAGKAIALYVLDGTWTSGDPQGLSYAGDDSFFYSTGWQLETGSTPSSYIATSGSTVTRAAETLSIAAANMDYDATAMSLAMEGEISYADRNLAAQQVFFNWAADGSNYISLDLDTDSTATGEVNANQSASGTVDTVVAGAQYTAGLNVPFSIASRNTSGAINVAKDGTAATADTTPTALPALGSTAASLAPTFNGYVSMFRQWSDDIGDTGIGSAST